MLIHRSASLPDTQRAKVQQELDDLEKILTLWTVHHKTQQTATRELFMQHDQLPPIATVDAYTAAKLDQMLNQLITARNTLTAVYSTTPISTYACAQAKADFFQKRTTIQAGMRMSTKAGAWVLKIQNSGMLKQPVLYSPQRAAEKRKLTLAERVTAADSELEQVAATLAAAKTHRTFLKLQLLNLNQPGQCM